MNSVEKPKVSRAARIALTFVFGILISLQASAQTLAKDDEKRDKAEDKDLLALSPFLVKGRTDVGYSSQKSVIGSRSVKELIDLPTAITIINRELIDDLAASKLSDVIGYGVSGVIRNQTLSDDSTLRGFRTQFPLRDGTIKFGYIKNQLYDVERIEVIKGPAAMLLGDDTFLGGAVNYISRQPTAKHVGSMHATYGADSYIRLALNDSGPVYKSENFTALYRATVGYTHSDAPRELEGLDDQFFGAALAFYFGNRTTVQINSYRMFDHTYLYWNEFLDRTRTPASGTFAYINPLSRDELNPARKKDVKADSTETFINATITTRLTENSDLRIFGSFVNHKNDSIFVNWNSLAADNYTLTRRIVYQLFDADHSAIQVDYLHRFERGIFKNELTVGGDLYFVKQIAGVGLATVPGTIDARAKPNLSSDDTILPKIHGNVSSGYSRVRNMQATYYVQDNVRLWGEKLALVGGVRWFNPTEYNDNLLSGITTRSQKKTSAGNKYGIVIKPLKTPTLSLYATKAANTIPLVGFNTSNAGVITPLKDQEGKLTEFGIKANHALTDRVSVYGTAARFEMELTNVRTFRVNPDGTSDSFQSEKNTSKGFELDFGLRVQFESGAIDLIATYMDLDTFDATTKKPAVSAPENAWSLLGKYTVTSGRLKSLKVGVGTRDEGLKLQRAFYLNHPQTYTAFIGYDVIKNLSVQVNVDNLTDKDYLVAAAGFQFGQKAEPRRIKLMSIYKW